MKAILMAAGVGSRISRSIQGIPKSIVDVGGISLIENTINQLKKKGITEIAIVVGYKAHIVKSILENHGVTIFYNPFYEKTNSIASLWFAKEFIKDDDCLFMNGDVFFEPALLDLVMDEKMRLVLFSDESRKEEGDYKLFYHNNRLIDHGKDLPLERITGEYIGIAKIAKGFLPLFIQRLEQLIDTQKHNLWWENVIYSFIGEMDVNVRDVQNLFWGEVDYLEDYNRILEYIKMEALVNTI